MGASVVGLGGDGINEDEAGMGEGAAVDFPGDRPMGLLAAEEGIVAFGFVTFGAFTEPA